MGEGERAVAELVRRRDDRGARHGLVGPVAQRRRVRVARAAAPYTLVHTR